MWRGGVGLVYLFPALSSAGASFNPTVLRFHIPLIEPDGRYSRIRLSEETSRFRPREVGGSLSEFDQAIFGMKDFIRVPSDSSCPHLMLCAQPPAKPASRMLIDGSIGFTDRAKTEVVRPAKQLSVDRLYLCLCFLLSTLKPRGLADFSTDALHSFLRRCGAQIGFARLRRVASADAIPQKIEALFRQAADPRLGLVDRQLQFRHDLSCRHQSLFRSVAATDNEIVRIRYDLSLKTLFVSKVFPPQHEAAHVEIAEQR